MFASYEYKLYLKLSLDPSWLAFQHCVSIFEVLDSNFTMLMIKSEIFHFCSLQVTFCFKKNIFWIPFMHSIHSLSQFYKEPIYVADSLVKISVEVRAT